MIDYERTRPLGYLRVGADILMNCEGQIFLSIVLFRQGMVQFFASIYPVNPNPMDKVMQDVTLANEAITKEYGMKHSNLDHETKTLFITLALLMKEAEENFNNERSKRH